MKSKKSLIIAPALAALFVAAAGSVSGTVAWFSAVRVFNTQVGNFSVVETEGNLDCVLAAGQGTVYDSGTNSVSVRSDADFVDNGKGDFTLGLDDSKPVAPTSGDFFYATDTNKMYKYTTDWVVESLNEGDYYYEKTKGQYYQVNGSSQIGDPVADNPAVLTHGSVCHTGTNEGHAFVINSDTDPENPSFYDRGTVAGTDWRYRNGIAVDTNESKKKTIDIYVAVSWTMTFTYSFNGESKPVGIYLDLGKTDFNDETSVFTFDEEPASRAEATKKGFRIGFYGSGRDVVLGNNKPVTGVAAFNPETAYTLEQKAEKNGIVYECITAGAHAWDPSRWKPTGQITTAKYVSATNEVSDYDEDVDYVVHDAGYTPVSSDTEYQTWAEGFDVPERICVLTNANPSITITCAAWYEGTDPNVVSGAAMDCLSASLHFYSRTLVSGARS